MMYRAECNCGNAIPVELWQAGTRIDCEKCNREIVVPNSIALKEQSGDKHPFLNSIEKLKELRGSGEPPFDGTCHGCGEVQATWEIPASLRILTERILDDDGGIRPSLTGGVKLVVSAGEEVWRVVRIPFLLCTDCHDLLEADRRAAKRRKIFGWLFLFALSAGFLWYANLHDELPVAIIVVFAIVAAIAKVWSMRSTRSVEPYAIDWLERIDLVADIIDQEEKFELALKTAEPYHPKDK